jgi:hypothetical protein
MIETVREPDEPEYSRVYEYDTTGACTVKALWLSGRCVWLESVDGQRVVIPEDMRKLISKRIREVS